MISENLPARPVSDAPGASQAPSVIRVASPAALLDIAPFLLGFHPDRSIVVIAIGQPPRGRVRATFRYDLPDPPREDDARGIAGHAAEVLARAGISRAAIIGYGTSDLADPAITQISSGLAEAGIEIFEALRAEDGRYWSYTCQNPECCPPEGVPFGQAPGPGEAEAVTCGMTALPAREDLAATIAPQAGEARSGMRRATTAARQWATRLARDPATGRAQVTAAGSDLLSQALTACAGDARIGYTEAARLSVLLASVRVRDEAWTRIDPADISPHLALWSDMTRRAVTSIPACASLLAFAAWTSGNGALANIAIDRALAADPGYAMAHLIRQALQAGMPPMKQQFMTTAELAARYGEQPIQPA